MSIHDREIIKRLDEQIEDANKLLEVVNKIGVTSPTMRELIARIILQSQFIRANLEGRIKDGLKSRAYELLKRLRDVIEEPHAYIMDLEDVLGSKVLRGEEWRDKLLEVLQGDAGSYSRMYRQIEEVYSDGLLYCDELDEAIDPEEEEEEA